MHGYVYVTERKLIQLPCLVQLVSNMCQPEARHWHQFWRLSPQTVFRSGESGESATEENGLATRDYARARSAKQHRQDSATSAEQLDGLEPVVEDWHTMMCMFEVHKYIVMDMYICLTSW